MRAGIEWFKTLILTRLCKSKTVFLSFHFTRRLRFKVVVTILMGISTVSTDPGATTPHSIISQLLFYMYFFQQVMSVLKKQNFFKPSQVLSLANPRLNRQKWVLNIYILHIFLHLLLIYFIGMQTDMVTKRLQLMLCMRIYSAVTKSKPGVTFDTYKRKPSHMWFQPLRGCTW